MKHFDQHQDDRIPMQAETQKQISKLLRNDSFDKRCQEPLQAL